MACYLVLLVFFFFCSIKQIFGFNFGNSILDLQIEIGKNSGFDKSSTISQESLKKIIRGAENGKKDDMYFYALLRHYGNSVPADATVAANYFRKAASIGHMEAQTAYAIMLVSGLGIPQDYNEAVKWLRKSVADGDKEATWLLAIVLCDLASQKRAVVVVDGQAELEAESLRFQEAKYKEALMLLHKAADEYHISQAEYYLALMYEYSIAVTQNFDTAAEYYKRAAEKMHIDSMYNLALMYTYGRGCNQNYKRAFALFDNAVRISGHKSSAYYLALFRMYGYGCEPNYSIAINWFEFASGADDPVIAEKALKSANELREMLDLATETNNDVLDQLRTKSEKAQSASGSDGLDEDD